MTPRRESGFTLVELLIVVTIIAILLSLMVPALDRATDMAERARCGANLHALFQGVIQYAHSNRRTVPPILDTGAQKQDNNGWPRWFFLLDTASTTTGHYWNLGLLWRDKYLRDNGQGYFCPSQPNIWFKYSSYAANGFPTNWPEPGPTNGSGVRISYFYNPQTQSLTDRTRVHRRLANMSSASLLIVDCLEGISTLAHGPADWNIAGGDGAVRYAHNEKVLEDMVMPGFTGTDFASFDSALEKLTRTW